MPTPPTIASVDHAPVLVKTPMSEEEYLALGETKHHEYYDGMCVVNPPNRRHQRAEAALFRLLDPHVPDGYELFVEWGWRTGGSWFEPDLMVVTAAGPMDIAIEPPLLIVEIMSPSNRLDDLVTKREKYASGGLPWYWTLDVERPCLTVLRAIDGLLVGVQRLLAPGTTVGPFQVNIDPDVVADPPLR